MERKDWIWIIVILFLIIGFSTYAGIKNTDLEFFRFQGFVVLEEGSNQSSSPSIEKQKIESSYGWFSDSSITLKKDIEEAREALESIQGK